MAQCRSCSAEVVFVTSEANGRLMILDKEPVANGNIVIVDGKARVLAKDLFASGEVRPVNGYVDHHSTCPDAAK